MMINEGLKAEFKPENEDRYPALLPCPFCGWFRIGVERGPGYVVAFCDSCGAQVQLKDFYLDDDGQKAIRAKWNTRRLSAPAPAVPAVARDAGEVVGCRDCGTPLNEGEAKCFTVCDDCWDKHFGKRLAVPAVAGDAKGVEKWNLLREWLETDKKNGQGHKVNRALFLMDELDSDNPAASVAEKEGGKGPLIIGSPRCPSCGFEGGHYPECPKRKPAEPGQGRARGRDARRNKFAL